jgi:protein kinase C substrate 80K-H
VFRFSGGAYCYNGPSRSALVEVECGVENELFEVDEPRTCEYTMKFRSPAGCDVKHAKGLKLEMLDETDAD